ncbi:MAG: hypothetical protein J6R28_00795 [Bacteroides sp.]|nr:hypothetical protein [Bacteroides sp.]
MKKTTKIIIGLLVGMPLLIVTFIFLFTRVLMQPTPNRNFDLRSGNSVTIELPVCKAIEFKSGVEYKKVSEGRYQAIDQFFFNEHGNVYLTSTTDAQGKFTISEKLKPFTEISMQGDTCVITFAFPREKCPEQFCEAPFLHVASGDMHLTLPKDVVYIADHLLNLFSCQGLSHERLTFNANARIDIFDSNIDTLNVQSSRLLQLRSGHVKHLFVDADKVNWQQSYNVAFVDVEHISGTRDVRRHVTSDSNRIVWEPKSDHARLELVLAGPMEVEVNKPSE